MQKYIGLFPQPFLDDLISGRCIPFIGAGFSRNAIIPSNNKMPLWDELGKSLADLIPGYDYSGPIDSISAYEHEYSRAKLVEKLSECLLIDIAKPGNAHKAFCSLPFDIVCTTNLEFLLERGYESIQRYCCPIVEEDRLAVSTNGSGVNLIKLHGDLHHPNHMIVTEDDYDLFIERYPLFATFLANLLISKTAVLIGYSLDDPDLRHIWQVVGERLGKLRRQAYALAVNAKPHIIARFERRGVKVINLPGKESDYALILANVFDELKAYWETTLLSKSTASEEDSHSELSLPEDAENRLCYFAIPYNLLPFYKSVIFPIVESFGFIPITAEEIISPGDNLTAKISALIGRSKIIIADISTNNAISELKLALSDAAKSRKILVILEEEREVPFNFLECEVIKRSKKTYENAEVFAKMIVTWFSKVAEEIRPRLEDEPKRLLDKREYRAAVITAVSLLEVQLRFCFDFDFFDQRSYHMPIMKMLNLAIKNQYLDSGAVEQIKKWVDVRNNLVHTDRSINGHEARSVVNGIYGIIRRLKESERK